MNDDITLDSCLYKQESSHGDAVLFQFIFYFAIGLILAPFSFGFVIVLIFIILYEIWYANSVGTDKYYGFERGALIGVFVLGFVIGRIIIGDDDPIRKYYHKYPRRQHYRNRRFH